MLMTVRILGLGPALSIIGEWKPADFSHFGGLEAVLLIGLGSALWRGVTLPPVRIVILLGLVHMALSAERNAEIFGLVAPLVVARPLASQFASIRAQPRAGSRPGACSPGCRGAADRRLVPVSLALVRGAPLRAERAHHAGRGRRGAEEGPSRPDPQPVRFRRLSGL